MHEAHEVNMMKIQKGYANYWEIIISAKKKKKKKKKIGHGFDEGLCGAVTWQQFQ